MSKRNERATLIIIVNTIYAGRDVVEYFVLAKAESNTALMTKWDNYTDIIFTLEESNAPVQLNVISANKTQSSVFTENTRDPSIPLNFSKP